MGHLIKIGEKLQLVSHDRFFILYTYIIYVLYESCRYGCARVCECAAPFKAQLFDEKRSFPFADFSLDRART